jgi:dTDP-4-dehydrorhamnose reductase
VNGGRDLATETRLGALKVSGNVPFAKTLGRSGRYRHQQPGRRRPRDDRLDEQALEYGVAAVGKEKRERLAHLATELERLTVPNLPAPFRLVESRIEAVAVADVGARRADRSAGFLARTHAGTVERTRSVDSRRLAKVPGSACRCGAIGKMLGDALYRIYAGIAPDTSRNRLREFAMRYAVIGAAGQLGRDLCPRLAGDVVALGRAEADVTRPDLVRATLTSLRPDVVINCAAYNFVDKAESEPAAVFAVNAWAVRDLAMVCRDLGCTLIHFSTDYVFGLDAERRTSWQEGDAPGPVSVYGLSKLAGEYLMRSVCPRHFVIRSCGLYGVWGSGGKGGNFVETMLRVAGLGKPLRVVADQICTPTYTVDLAAAVAALIGTDRFGLYHVTSGGSCSWHDFAAAIFEIAGVNADLTPISSAEFGAPAHRPPYSVLSNRALEAAGVTPPRPWRDALTCYLEERKRKSGVT